MQFLGTESSLPRHLTLYELLYLHNVAAGFPGKILPRERAQSYLEGDFLTPVLCSLVTQTHTGTVLGRTRQYQDVGMAELLGMISTIQHKEGAWSKSIHIKYAWSSDGGQLE